MAKGQIAAEDGEARSGESFSQGDEQLRVAVGTCSVGKDEGAAWGIGAVEKSADGKVGGGGVVKGGGGRHGEPY